MGFLARMRYPVWRNNVVPAAIVDIESSGFGADAFPVSIAWHILGTRREGHVLIRPAPGWRGWDAEAEEIHGIALDRLRREGQPAATVAERLGGEWRSMALYSDAPALDQRWLDRLFAELPGVAAPSLRRLPELFSVDNRHEWWPAVQGDDSPPDDMKALSDVRRLAAAVSRYGLASRAAAG